MTLRLQRVFFYLALALVCYATALVFGHGVGFGVFVVAGAIGELCFWIELFRPRPKSEPDGAD